MEFKKTSLMHQDIGGHEHIVTIYDSYETYAVCDKCGMHDWSIPEIKDPSGQDYIDHFKNKYPKHRVYTFEQQMKDYEEWGKEQKKL